jgi:AcrR family transcriptional regulator
MAAPALPRPKKKRAGHYHHGDLRRALLEEALRTIQAGGVEALTLRAVGEKLGVSRTALYRHFSDKQALLAVVGREGFRMLRLALTDALEQHGRGPDGFEAMGVAYVQFAVTHPSHYRVMFGRFIESCSKDAELVQEATAAFQVLVDSLVEQQQAGLVRRDDPIILARFIWAIVHGIAMLVIDGQLRGVDERGEALNQYAIERIRDAISLRSASFDVIPSARS